MTRSYVKEIQNVIDLGYSPDDVCIIYDELTYVLGNYAPLYYSDEEIRQKIRDKRKNNRSSFHADITYTLWRLGFGNLSWRQVKFEYKRVKRCEQCQNLFYDYSRNGRKITCDRYGIYRSWDSTNRKFRYHEKHGKKLSVCAARYEQERKPTIRKRQEIPFDPSPSALDKTGHALLNEVEMAHQRHLAEKYY